MIHNLSSRISRTDYGSISESDNAPQVPVKTETKKASTPKPEKKGSWIETLLKPIVGFIYGLYDFLSGIQKMLGLFFGKKD